MNEHLRSLLQQAREEIYARVPSKLIQVPDGDIFTPGSMGLFGTIGGIPKAGESAGYRTIMNTAGNWSSGIGPWRVQHMLWAENPEYERTWILINRIDELLATTP